MDSDLHGGTRIAVLIDADNTSPKYAEALLEEVAKYGTPTIKRAYGDFTSPRMAGWTRELNARAIRSIHQTAFSSGKNSTDSALIIDAMDLLYADNVEAFAIVSSDSDFTSLALRLRESGKKVYGLGRKTTLSSLQNACDRFIALEVLMTEAQDDEPEDKGGDSKAAEQKPGAQEAPSLNLQSAITKAVNATADEDGWTSLSALGQHIRRTHASFDPRSWNKANLSSLVAEEPYLETSGTGNEARVRLKGKQAPAKAPAKKAGAKRAAAKTAPAKTAPATTETATTEPAKAQPAKTATSEAGVPTVKVTTRTRTAKKAAPRTEPKD